MTFLKKKLSLKLNKGEGFFLRDDSWRMLDYFLTVRI